jgi:Flp pilus assembly protein TadG
MRARSTIRSDQRGATSLQILVILVPVIFGFMGFAVDLARLYLVRMELQTAANAAALAAASRLAGTDASTTQAEEQVRLSLDAGSGYGNRYDFGSVTIGEGTSFLTSEAPVPAFYETLAAALEPGSGGSAAGSTARHTKITVRAEAPLVFFGFLPIAQERKTPIEVSAVAGVSAPVCTACGIEPVALQAIDPEDLTDFGYIRGSRYTLGYSCTGTPTPSIISGTERRIPYVLVNRYNDQLTIFPEESSQAFRVGAQGMLPTATPDSTADPTLFNTRACITINTEEGIWLNAAPIPCNTNRVASQVTAFVCGLASRFETAVPGACAGIADVDTMSTLYLPDTDINDITEYTQYAGTGRRVITVAVVTDVATTPMLALGFRQFLIEPNPDSTTLAPGDANGRFSAIYIGYPRPLRQGRFDGGCQVTTGPGKVVLHQ